MSAEKELTEALPSSVVGGEGAAAAAAVAAPPTAATTSSTEKPAAPVPMFQMSNAVSLFFVFNLILVVERRGRG